MKTNKFAIILNRKLDYKKHVVRIRICYVHYTDLFLSEFLL